MQFETNKALYLQIADELRRRILEGILEPGERILPVRQFSAELGVTPNTLQRAFADLEREGLLYTDRTSGRFVTEDREKIRKLRQISVKDALEEFVELMRNQDFRDEEIVDLVEKELKRRQAR